MSIPESDEKGWTPKAGWDQSDWKTWAFGEPAFPGQVQGFTAWVGFKHNTPRPSLWAVSVSDCPAEGCRGPRAVTRRRVSSFPQLHKQNGPHPMVPSSQGKQPSCILTLLWISPYPPARQATKIHLNASSALCLFIPSGTRNQKPQVDKSTEKSNILIVPLF